jgi:hypothetical protein
VAILEMTVTMFFNSLPQAEETPLCLLRRHLPSRGDNGIFKSWNFSLLFQR